MPAREAGLRCEHILTACREVRKPGCPFRFGDQPTLRHEDDGPRQPFAFAINIEMLCRRDLRFDGVADAQQLIADKSRIE